MSYLHLQETVFADLKLTIVIWLHLQKTCHALII